MIKKPSPFPANFTDRFVETLIRGGVPTLCSIGRRHDHAGGGGRTRLYYVDVHAMAASTGKC